MRFLQDQLRAWARDFRNTFGFTERQTKGVIILFLLMLTFLIAPFFIKPIFRSFWNRSTVEADQQLLIHWVDSMEQTRLNVERSSLRRTAEIYQNIQPFAFNPNHPALTSTELKSLGFSKYAADNLLRYVSKGGKIRSKKDLLKIYGVDSVLVTNVLWDYIMIPSRSISPEVKSKTQEAIKEKIPKDTIPKESSEKNIVEKTSLNTAQIAQLTKVKGIGNVYGQCICDHRDRLGGYVSFDQVLERCSLKSSVFRSLKTHFYIGQYGLKKIDLNRSSAKEMAGHPYISAKLSNQIVLFRTHHGNFKTVEEILEIKTVSERLFKKLKPYLICSDTDGSTGR